MAFQSAPRVPNSQANVKLFGTQIADSFSQRSALFSVSEVGFYWDVKLRSHYQIKEDYLTVLNTGDEFFHKVEENIKRLSRLWDAVTIEKERYDASGNVSNDVQYMESLVLCANLVADRSSLGHDNLSVVQRYRDRLNTSTIDPSMVMRTANVNAPLRSVPISLPNMVRTQTFSGLRPANEAFPSLPLQRSPNRQSTGSVLLSSQLLTGGAAEARQGSGETTDDCQSCTDTESSVDVSEWDEEDPKSTVEVRPLTSHKPWATRAMPHQATPEPTWAVSHPNNKRTHAAITADGDLDAPM
jgi:hypothetical protein